MSSDVFQLLGVFDYGKYFCVFWKKSFLKQINDLKK